ncbi:MAG TPA: HEAT repeat domain-containing protein [Caldilineaceae bacterium]|nr:HEAT repeat domain-containing protein [Caldilineaceae bacterium]
MAKGKKHKQKNNQDKPQAQHRRPNHDLRRKTGAGERRFELRPDDELSNDALSGDELEGLDAQTLRRLSEALGEDFEIVGPEDEQEVWDDAVPPIRATISLDQLLHRLTHEQGLPPLHELYALSDLSRTDAETLRQHWEEIPVIQRREVINQLVNLAEENLDLHLGPMLRVALGDADADVRQAAVRGLWEDQDADLIGPLVQLLYNDPATMVRAAAATALGSYVLAGELEELDTALAMRAEEALLAVHTDASAPLEVRRRALEAIAFSGEAGVRQLIEDAYYSPDEPMRVSALFAMGRSADIRWRGLVRAELRNPSPAMRAEAAIACGELEARAALDDLLDLLNDHDENVRLASIFALGRIGGQDASDALEMIMAGDNAVEAEAAEHALEEMQFYAEVNAVSLFDESLDDEEEWDVDPSDEWYEMDERALGEYEPDDDELDFDDQDLDDEDE